MRMRVRRGPTEGAREVRTYELPEPPPAGLRARTWSELSVSNVLAWLQAEREPRLGYELACRRGLCNVCVVRANGVPVRACITPFADDMLVGPARDHLQLHDTIGETSLVRDKRATGVRV